MSYDNPDKAKALFEDLENKAAALKIACDDFLDKGLISCLRDAKQMLTDIEGTQAKLVKIGVVAKVAQKSRAKPESNSPFADAWQGKSLAEQSSPVPEATSTHKLCLKALEYHWEISPCDAWLHIGVRPGQEVDYQISACRVRVKSDAGTLNLPLPFEVDVDLQPPAKKSKRTLQIHFLRKADGVLPGARRLAWDIDTTTQGMLDAFLEPTLADEFRNEILELWETGRLSPGEIHAGRRDVVRSDLKAVLDSHDSPALAQVTRKVDLLVAELINHVSLLQIYKMRRDRPMVTVYPPGARYSRHYDAFKGDTARVLTVMVYLNPIWDLASGGELRIFPGRATPIDVEPLHGRLVAFLCDSMNAHEVLESHFPRVAATFWYESY